jgi:hypothetical protein
MNSYLSQIAIRSAGQAAENYPAPMLRPAASPVFSPPDMQEEIYNSSAAFPPSTPAPAELPASGKGTGMSSQQTRYLKEEPDNNGVRPAAPSYLQQQAERSWVSGPAQKTGIPAERKAPAVAARDLDTEEKPPEKALANRADLTPLKTPLPDKNLVPPVRETKQQPGASPPALPPVPIRSTNPREQLEPARLPDREPPLEAAAASPNPARAFKREVNEAFSHGKPPVATPAASRIVTPVMPVAAAMPAPAPVKKVPAQPKLVIGRLTVQVLPPVTPVAPAKQRAGRRPTVNQPMKNGKSSDYKLRFGLGQL